MLKNLNVERYKMTNLSKQINRMHQELVRNSVKTASKIGGLLTEQKELCGHGNFDKWCDKNLGFSKATVTRYMNVFEWLQENENVNLEDLKLSELYKEIERDKEKSRTPEEKAERRKKLRKQDDERTKRREKFANRKHKYKNPRKGKYANEIICGNFEDVMPEMIDNGMKEMFDALICSVPYNNGKEYGNGYDDSKEYSEYLEMLKQYISLSYDLLRKGGRLILNFDEMNRKGMAGDHHHMLEADIINMIREMGLELYELDKIIWYKKNSGSDWLTCWGSYGSPSSPKLRNKFETILVFSKQEHTLPALEGMEVGITEEEFKDWTKNVWEIHPVNTRTPHPAAYVEELTNRLIKLYTWQGSLVGDFFCGSGTTCKSAQMLNRNYFGADQNPNFAQYSRDRLDMTKQELQAKYAEFIGGKTKKVKAKKAKSKKTKFPKLVTTKLNNNVTFEKKSA